MTIFGQVVNLKKKRRIKQQTYPLHKQLAKENQHWNYYAKVQAGDHKHGIKASIGQGNC